jgi:hypothetical protein
MAVEERIILESEFPVLIYLFYLFKEARNSKCSARLQNGTSQGFKAQRRFLKKSATPTVNPASAPTRGEPGVKPVRMPASKTRRRFTW